MLSRDISDFHSYLRWNSIQKHIDRDVTTLDIGCNIGTMTLEIARRGTKPVVGIDLDPVVVAKARERAQRHKITNCTFLSASATDIPFDDGSFDQIIVADVLEHVENDRGIISECHRLLKPGGKLIINAPRPNYSTLFNKEWIKHIGHIRDGYEFRDVRKLTGGLFEVESFDFNSRAKAELDNFYNKGLQVITDELLERVIAEEDDLSREPFGVTVSLRKMEKKETKELPLKVLHVGWGHPPNLAAGPIYYLHNLCIEQQTDNMQTACFVAGEAKGTADAPTLVPAEFDGIRYFMVEGRPAHYFDWKNPRREADNDEVDILFEKTLAEWNPDIVHFHNLVGLSMSLPIVAKKYGIPTIFSAHNYWMMCARDDLFAPNERICNGPQDGSRCASCVGSEGEIDGFVYRTARAQEVFSDYCDRVLAVSERVGRLLEEFGVLRSKITVQHIGSVAAEEIWNRVGQRRTFPIPWDGQLKFAYFGTLSVRKGSHLLLEAASHLDQYRGRFVIEIYGGGEPKSYRKRLDALMHEYPLLKDVIVFKGGYSQSQMAELLAGIDVAIIPPLWEDNGPQTVMEVLSGRVPVIGARVGGVPDFVIDGVNGFLFEPGSPSGLALAMRRILDNPGLIGRFADGIHPPVTMEKHSEELRSHYESIILDELLNKDEKDRRVLELYSDSQNLIGENDLDGAMEKLHELLRISPVHVDARNDIAVIYQMKGEMNLAKKHLELAVLLNGTDPVTMKNLATILYSTGEKERSLAFFKKLMYSGNLDINTLITMAGECKRLERLGESKEFLTAAVRIDPTNPLVAAGLLEIDAALNRVGKSTAELHALSKVLASSGKVEEAMEKLERILEISSKNPDALIDLSELCKSSGDSGRALELLEKLLVLQPRNIDAYKRIGMLLLKTGELGNALNALYQALAISPRDTESLLCIADACLKMGKVEEAAVFYEDVLKYDPQNTIASSRLVSINGGGSLNKIQEGPIPCKNDKSTEANALYEQAQSLIEVQNFEMAKRVLSDAIRIDSDNTSILNDLAVLDIITGNLKDAIDLLQRALEIDPGNKAVLENISIIQNATSSMDNKENLQRIACPYCGVDDAASYRKTADIVKCNVCGTVYLRTRYTPKQMETVYQDYAKDGSALEIPKSKEEIKTSGLRRDYFLDEITSIFKKRGLFLDVGCAWGAFLDNARSRGFTPRGIEITRDRAEFACNNLNLNVTSDQFVDTHFDPASVAVISMIHVFEHLPDPKVALRKAFEILEPGGVFAGIVPNIESLCSTVLKENWAWLQPMYHYVHYSPRTLKRHLEEVGFVVEGLYTTTGDYDPKAVEQCVREAYNSASDQELQSLIHAVEKQGFGEEIRFFAMKPESSPIISKKATNLYADAQAKLAKGKLDNALGILNEVVRISPDHADAHNDLAVLYHQRGDIKSAIAHLETSIRLKPGDVVSTKNLAILYSGSGEYEKALELFQRLLQRNPNDDQALLSVADICIRLNRFADAKHLFNKVLSVTKDVSLRGRVLSTIGELDKLPLSGTAPEASEDAVGTAQPSARPSVIVPETSRLASIIIPVFNKAEFTRNCLQSIKDKVGYKNYEVIVVDNASTDETQSLMNGWTASDNRFKYIRNQTNMGFVDACNIGAEFAKGDYIVLLNNDTTVNENWLEALVDFAERTDDCGGVGSKLIYPDGRLQEAGGIIFSDANGWNYGRGGNPDHPKFNFIREVDYISGASLLVKKSVWEKAGGLDRRYAPAYYEDADLCFSVRKLGYKVYYEPRSSLVHYEGATSGTNLAEGFKRFQVLNRPKFMEKWKTELASQRANDPRNVEAASSRGIVGRVLVIDPILPMFDRAAGSLHLFNILKSFKSMNLHITFIATNWGLFDRYKPILQDMGIETYAGDSDAMYHFGYRVLYPKIDYQALFSERQFDFAVIDFWYQAEYYIPIIRRYSPATKVIVDSEDVHFVREIREAELKKDRKMKQGALEKKRREIAIYGKADQVWVVTEEDKKALFKAGVNVSVEIRPVIHDLPVVSSEFAGREGLLFVGNFNHTPNQDAISYFVREVLPQVRKSIPDVRLYIVGNDPGNEVSALASQNVVVVGYVPDLAEYYGKCRVTVAPLRFGAGLKGKIVESLSYGVPVVTTSIGIEGTGLADGQEVYVADNPSEMARKIADAYTSENTWSRLSRNGRARMEATWSHEAGRKRLREIISNLASITTKKGDVLTSIVMLTFNQLEYTRMTIDSIRRSTKTPIELIVVDNASSDGTVEYLKSQKDIHAIFNEENLGFPAGCNQGIEASTGDYILLLNNDVIVPKEWLEGLIECAESSPKIGIVGPMSNRISGYQLEQNVGYRKVSQVQDFAAKYRRKNRKRWIEVPRVAGFCMLIKRDLIDKIGGLDTAFGMGNCEDDDFCVRARLAGYGTVVAGDVFIHHFGSVSFGKDGLEKYKEFIRVNERVFKEKWGVTPLEWWREGKNITKASDLFVPLQLPEPEAVQVSQ